MATSQVVNTTQLTQQLSQELELTLSLQQCLEKERHALEQQDTEALMNNASHKDQLVQQLEQSARLREQLLSQQGLPADRSGMQQLLDTTNDSKLQDCWQKLCTAAEQCRENNRQLGMLIQREQTGVRQAQHILQRGTTVDNHSYDSSGQSGHDNTTRNIGKA